MFCTHCGNQVADGSNFCTKCGANQTNAGNTTQGTAYSPGIPMEAPVNGYQVISLIPDNIFLNISNIISNPGWNAGIAEAKIMKQKAAAKPYISSGIFVMQTLLMIPSYTDDVKKRWEKKGRPTIGSKTTELDLLEFASSMECKSYEKEMLKICSAIKIDPIVMKTELGRTTGGGNKYVGWGTAGAVGLGIGMSAMSSLGQGARNLDTNRRTKSLEGFFFYNNVASYFAENVFPTIQPNPFY